MRSGSRSAGLAGGAALDLDLAAELVDADDRCALPNAPGHDGIRLFLPSIASLAILAGLGAGWLGERLRTGRRRVIAPLLVAAAIGECLVGIARLYPYTDSYYNGAIGGLKGAERAGFEVTYYWETAGSEFLEWAREKAREKPVSIAFPMDAPYHDLLREWGEIPTRVRIVALNEPPPGEPIRCDYFVLQSRRGFYYPRTTGWTGMATPCSRFAVKGSTFCESSPARNTRRPPATPARADPPASSLKSRIHL